MDCPIFTLHTWFIAYNNEFQRTSREEVLIGAGSAARTKSLSNLSVVPYLCTANDSACFYIHPLMLLEQSVVFLYFLFYGEVTFLPIMPRKEADICQLSNSPNKAPPERKKNCNEVVLANKNLYSLPQYALYLCFSILPFV